MNASNISSNLPKRLAEYFVVCGLPEDPKPYDVSKILTHAEEIRDIDSSIDFTRFLEPIVDIQIVNLKENEKIPDGYYPITSSYYGSSNVRLKLNFADEACICYRRGRDRPYIKDIGTFTLNANSLARPDATVIDKTISKRPANLLSPVSGYMYLTYLKSTENSGVDELAVTDICIIIPGKQEICPPAYQKIPDPIHVNSFRMKAFLCYRKSLFKEFMMSYEPKVLFWYRVPNAPVEWEKTCSEKNTSEKDVCVKDQRGDDSLSNIHVYSDGDICGETLPKTQVTPLDADICQVANFCLPWGASIESWSVQQTPPEVTYFRFMLTNESYQKLYGVAFTFYEPYIKKLDPDKCYRLGIDPELAIESDDKLLTDLIEDPQIEAEITIRQKHFMKSRIGDRIIGVTKTLCLLSRWSFTVPFSNFLCFFYSRCLPSAKSDPIPFERYLGHFLFEIPFPDQTLPNISYELCAAPIQLDCPEEIYSFSSCEPFFSLLDTLNVDTIIHLLIQMLTEQKILMSSVRHSLLSDIGEALTNKPLKQLKTKLNELKKKINMIRIAILREHKSQSRRMIMDCMLSPSDSIMAKEELDKIRKRRSIGLLIKQAFLQFMVHLLRDYRTCLVPVRNANGDVLFNTETFLREYVDKSTIPFYRALLETQQWANFVRDRIYSSPRDEELDLFDNYIQLLIDDEQHSLLSVKSMFSSKPGGSQTDVHSLDGVTSSTSSLQDDIFSSFNEKVVDNEYPLRIGLPCWPVPEMYMGEISSSDVTNNPLMHKNCWTHGDFLGIFPVNLHSKTLDRLALNAFLMQALHPADFSKQCLNDNFCLQSSYENINRTDCPISVNNLSNQNPLLNIFGTKIPFNGGFDNRCCSLGFCDNPSPLRIRSTQSQTTGLIGIYTPFTLPLSNVTILKRSYVELHAFMNREFNTDQSNGIEMARYIVASMYSIWFVQFPSYLATLLTFYTAMNSSTTCDSLNSVTTNAVQKTLRLAIDMFERIVKNRIPLPDQVTHRILLVLAYQNRMPNFDLIHFIDSIKWNPSSERLANHIYKAYEKELMEIKRMEELHRKTKVTGHNRSSSLIDSIDQSKFSEDGKPETGHKRSESVTNSNFDKDANSDALIINQMSRAPLASSDDLTDLGYSTLNKDDCKIDCKQNGPSVEGCSNTSSSNHSNTEVLGYALPKPLVSAKPPSVSGNPSVNFNDRQSHLGDFNLQSSSYHLNKPTTDISNSFNQTPSAHSTHSSSVSTTSHSSTNSSEDPEDTTTDYANPPIQGNIHHQSLDFTSHNVDRKFSLNPSSLTINREDHLNYSKSHDRNDDSKYKPSQPIWSSPLQFINRSTSDLTAKFVSHMSKLVGNSTNQSNQIFNLERHGSNSGNFTSYPLVHSEQIRRVPWSKQIESNELSKTGNILSHSKESDSVDHLKSYTSFFSAQQSVQDNLKPNEYSSDYFSDEQRFSRENNVNYQLSRQAQSNSELKSLKDLWIEIAGPMIAFPVAKRFGPANIRTVIMQQSNLSLDPNNIHNDKLSVPGISTSSNPFEVDPYCGLSSRSSTASPVLGNKLFIHSKTATPLHDENPKSEENSFSSINHKYNSEAIDSDSSVTGSAFNRPVVSQLNVYISTCSTCPQCSQYVYDEEIMGGWILDENEKNTHCPFCSEVFCPQMVVRIYAEVQNSKNKQNESIINSPDEYSSNSSLSPQLGSRLQDVEIKALIEKTYNFLSPFFVRKWLETLIQREGDECLRIQSASHCFLSRHEQLAWNLIWFSHRLGLPSHLLDYLPIWLINCQNEQLSLYKSKVNLSVKQSVNTSVFTDLLCQVHISPTTPVYISLRWTAYPVRSLIKDPLYKHWNAHKFNKSNLWSLTSKSLLECQHNNDANNHTPLLPPLPPKITNEATVCPLQTMLQNVVDAIRLNDMLFALEPLVRLRASFRLNSPLAVITNSSQRSNTTSNKAESAKDSKSGKGVNAINFSCDLQQHSSSLEGSLYRELLFLVLVALGHMNVDLVHFDQQYNERYNYLRGIRSPISEIDQVPSLTASACRQMLRRLTLKP